MKFPTPRRHMAISHLNFVFSRIIRIERLSIAFVAFDVTQGAGWWWVIELCFDFNEAMKARPMGEKCFKGQVTTRWMTKSDIVAVNSSAAVSY